MVLGASSYLFSFVLAFFFSLLFLPSVCHGSGAFVLSEEGLNAFSDMSCDIINMGDVCVCVYVSLWVLARARAPLFYTLNQPSIWEGGGYVCLCVYVSVYLVSLTRARLSPIP